MPFLGKSVPIKGVERAIKAIVAGTRRIDVYLTEDAKTILASLGSRSALILDKVGNKAEDIGREMKVNKTEK
jgi:hypothetical protein